MPEPSLLFRGAHWTLQIVLRCWPAGSRLWGEALAAELSEIENPKEAFRWALGGLMLFARASVSHGLAWLKLPVGSRLSAASLPLGSNAPILPKRSRSFTAAVLVATGILVFLPQSREAVSTVRASWNGYQGSEGDLRDLEKLAARAEREKDARTLAFVSLVLPHSDRATSLASRAVALDPTLVWIYASRVGRPEFAPPPEQGLTRLLETDHDNAFPELLAARVVSEHWYEALIYRGTPSDQEIEAVLASDPTWIAHMERAFQSQRYDSYFSQHWQLTREVWNRERSLSPSIAFVSLWGHTLPDYFSIKHYANLLVHQAQEVFVTGDAGRAENLLLPMNSFGRRVTEQSETDSERWMGLDLSRQATSELRKLYLREGKASESAAAAQRLQQIAYRTDILRHSFNTITEPQIHRLGRRAIFIHFSAALAVFLVFAIAFSLLALELWFASQSNRRLRMRGAICLAADWAPVALLAACIGLLWAFQPFASILRSLHSVDSASAAWHTLHFEGLFVLSTILGPLFDPFTPYHFWLLATCALVTLVLFLLARGFLRHKHA